jgi:hypothetical protein
MQLARRIARPGHNQHRRRLASSLTWGWIPTLRRVDPGVAISWPDRPETFGRAERRLGEMMAEGAADRAAHGQNQH